MPTTNLQPTSNQSPDSGQGGDAVNTPINTGHASTTVVGDGDGVTGETKTCRWFNFQSGPGGQIISIKLKFDHSSDGSRSGGGTANSFIVEYSLNGGSGWNSAVARANFNTLLNGSFSVDLPVGQNISQVQVRDQMTASAVLPGSAASVTASVSNIRLEVVTPDQTHLLVMM